MSWTDLSADHGQRVDGDTTRISVETKLVTIRPGRGFMSQLGWKKGDRVTVLSGEAEHHGLVRLKRAERGWCLVTPGGGTKSKDLLVLKLRKARAGRMGPLFPGMPDRLPVTVLEDAAVVGSVIQFRLPWIKEKSRDAPGAFARESAEAMQTGLPCRVQSSASAGSDPSGQVPDMAAAPYPAASGDPDVAGNAAGQLDPAPSVTAVTPERAGPPTPRAPFPIQDKTFAEVRMQHRAAVTSQDGGYGLMDAATTQRFVEAAATGASPKELAEISGRYARGSIAYLKNQLSDRIEAARALGEPVGRGTPEHPDIGGDAVPVEPVPKIPESVLKFLRDEVVPVLAPLGRRVAKNRDETGLLLDGKPITAEALVAEVNRLLREAGDDPLTLPSAA